MTNDEIPSLFLKCSVSELRQLSSRIGVCLSRLSDEQIWQRGGEHENAAGNLVLHLCGNVRQWIVSGVGGEPDMRRRDAEFAARDGVSRQELVERLETTIADAVRVIEALPAARLPEPLVIQGFSVTVLEAIYHVVEHFSMHAGQIMLLTKSLSGAGLGFYRQLDPPAKSRPAD
jgi:uncharacterized damage-inducible protein DinB